MYLTQESTERHRWGEDAVVGLDTCLADAVHEVWHRQDGTERAGTVLQEPAEQALDLSHSNPSDRMQHGRPPS